MTLTCFGVIAFRSFLRLYSGETKPQMRHVPLIHLSIDVWISVAQLCGVMSKLSYKSTSQYILYVQQDNIEYYWNARRWHMLLVGMNSCTKIWFGKLTYRSTTSKPAFDIYWYMLLILQTQYNYNNQKLMWT